MFITLCSLLVAIVFIKLQLIALYNIDTTNYNKTEFSDQVGESASTFYIFNIYSLF
jgi:hypothetical protein